MNIEQLKALTDSELNELAATKVMGWEKADRGDYVSYYDKDGTFIKDYAWNPTTDMNDAMELMDKFRVSELKWDKQFGYVSIIEGNAVFDKKSPSRAITIASILAKE